MRSLPSVARLRFLGKSLVAADSSPGFAQLFLKPVDSMLSLRRSFPAGSFSHDRSPALPEFSLVEADPG